MPERPPPAPLSGAAAVRHLLRRAGFGPGPGTEGLEEAGSYEAAVDELLGGLAVAPAEPAAGFDPYRPGAIQRAWLARMTSGRAPLAERLTLFWHGHFATSQSKVADGVLMWRQMETLRARGGGRFADLLLALSRDAAMVRWLDGNSNRKGHPNENFARELMELFALGRGAYSEGDVREAARCFTGWGTRHHTFVFTAAFHDDGEKTLLGRRGRLSGEDAVEIVASHPACAPFVCTKLLRAFSHPDPAPAEVEALAAVWRRSDGRIADVLRALLLDPAFRGPERARRLVRSPVAFAVAATRLCGLPEVPEGVASALDRLGQVPFRPPSVKGWPEGTAWLTAGTLVERLRAADVLAGAAGPVDVPALLAREFDGELPPALARALEGAAGRERLALALASPEFQVA